MVIVMVSIRIKVQNVNKQGWWKTTSGQKVRETHNYEKEINKFTNTI